MVVILHMYITKMIKKNLYHIVCFTTSDGKGRIKLKHDINPKTNKEVFALKNPKTVKRRSLFSLFKGFRIHKDDKPSIEIIKRKKK